MQRKGTEWQLVALPLPSYNKLRFNHPALSNMTIVTIVKITITITVIINEHINVITHNNYLQKRETSLNFLPYIFGHLKRNFTILLTDVNF